MNSLTAWLRGNAIWLLLMAVAFGFLVTGLRMGGQPASTPPLVGIPAGEHTTIELAEAPVGGDFEFVSGDDGETTRLSDLPPAWRWIYFGYTSCPDVCPSSLATMRHALNEVDASIPVDGLPVEGLFVSLDPERDRPRMVRDYATYFHASIRGGVLENITAELRSRYAVVAEQVAIDESAMGYAIDHTSSIYLVDPETRLRHVHAHGATARELIETLKRERSMTSAPTPIVERPLPVLEHPVAEPETR